MNQLKIMERSSADAILEGAVRALLDEAHRRLAAGEVDGVPEFLFEPLRNLQGAVSPSTWDELSRCGTLIDHPIRAILHSDPFMRRAFEKPRGYAGDAVLLDYIYGQDPGPETSPVGRAIFAYTTDAPASRAVRNRKGILTDYIDRAAAERPGARVLSLACGHLREALDSEAVRTGAVEVVAVDQDTESLAEVERTLGAYRVVPTPGSVKDVLKGQVTLADFDLVYAAGLYDYLPQPVARTLTARLFDAVRPGGTLLVANFVNGIFDVGLMETFMDWRLLYRDAADMVDLAADLSPHEVTSLSLFRDSTQNIVFLELRKAPAQQPVRGNPRAVPESILAQ